MVKIDSFTTNPKIFVKGDEKKITINWNAIIDSGDNPVDIYLKIEKNCPVFFIDASENQQKEVHLGAYNFTEEGKGYSDATFIIVTESQEDDTSAIITMTAIDKNKNKSKTACTIMYK